MAYLHPLVEEVVLPPRVRLRQVSFPRRRQRLAVIVSRLTRVESKLRRLELLGPRLCNDVEVGTWPRARLHVNRLPFTAVARVISSQGASGSFTAALWGSAAHPPRGPCHACPRCPYDSTRNGPEGPAHHGRSLVAFPWLPPAGRAMHQHATVAPSLVSTQLFARSGSYGLTLIST